MANGVNANLARRWVIGAEQGASSSGRLVAAARGLAQSSAFVPVQLPCAQATPGIQIELRRGATAMNITWPITAAADCAVWMRELLR